MEAKEDKLDFSCLWMHTEHQFMPGCGLFPPAETVASAHHGSALLTVHYKLDLEFSASLTM